MELQKPTAPVYVVDDDAGIREMLAELLADEGYAVVTATNGQDALRLLRTSAELPCLIVLDLMMPIMDGWQFRTVQMHDDKLAPIPVLVISAVEHVSSAVAQLQVAGCLAKPIAIHRLLSLIQQHCGAPLP